MHYVLNFQLLINSAILIAIVYFGNCISLSPLQFCMTH